MKKMVSIASVGASLAFFMCSPLNCFASSLSKEELTDRYALFINKWTEHGALTDVGVACTKTDQNGISENGVDYGAELASRELYLYGDYCIWDALTKETVFVGDYKECDHFYYVTKPDQTVCLIGADYSYYAARHCKMLFLPSELDNAPVTEIGAGCLMNAKISIPTLKEISVPDSITVIQHHAFCNAFGIDPEGCKINIPNQLTSLYAFSYGQLGNALGSKTVLPETLEYIDYSAFGTATYTELVLPESEIVCLAGCVQNKPSENAPVTAVRFGENCITADETVFSNKSVEAMLNEAEERREQFAAQATEQSIHYIGDLDENGEVNVMDSVMLARLVGDDPELEISDTGKANADFNADGAVDPNDLSDLLKYLAKF